MTTPPPGESILPEALTEEAVGERLREIRIALHDQGNSLRPTLLSLVGIVDALAFSAKCNFDAIRSLTNRSAAPPLTGEAVAESLIDDYCDMRPDLAAIRETLLDFGDRCAAVVLLRMRRAAPPVEATKSNVRQTDFAKPSVEADKPAEAGDEERAKSIAKAITQNNPQCYGYAESAAVMALAEGRALERVNIDHLTRALDVALHGEANAAKQASLCDLIQPASKLQGDCEAYAEYLRADEQIDSAIDSRSPEVADDAIERRDAAMQALIARGLWPGEGGVST